MHDRILEATAGFPPHLHRHILQMYVLRHRRPPRTAADECRAVYEYLTRGKGDKTGATHVFVHATLREWLTATDEEAAVWTPLPRLVTLLHQFSGDLRRRYDLAVERDCKEFACFVALNLAAALRWPEDIVAGSLREILWEPAPGVRSRSKIGVTRALHYVRRHAHRARHLQIDRIEDLSQLLASVLADIDEGRVPSYVLSPAQYDHLCQPVRIRDAKVTLTGLLHHLIVERGLVQASELSRPEVAALIAREAPRALARLKLPAPVRDAHRAHLAAVSAITPPVPPSLPARPMVTVVGPLSHGSGLGAAARACVDAFRSAEIPVEVLNLKAAWGRTDENAGADVTPRVRGDINVIHFNPDVLIENLARFGINQFHGRYNIGYFVWETSRLSLAHRLGVDLVDEIWVPTEYCRRLFAEVTVKPVVVVRTPVPKIEDVSWATRRYFELAPGRFTYVFTLDGASRFTRKNPIAAVHAFRRAFPTDDGVQLVIKTQNTDHLPPPDARQYAEIRRVARADRRVVVVDESFSSNEVHGLISVCDCYVALQRSEGFGYGMAEAMKLSVPVIATAHSGNADFTTEDTAYPVRHGMVPVAAADFVYDEPGQEWAEPDIEHAAQRMIEVRSGIGREARVERARALMQQRYSEAAVGVTYRDRIEAIRAGSTHSAVALGA